MLFIFPLSLKNAKFGFLELHSHILIQIALPFIIFPTCFNICDTWFIRIPSNIFNLHLN